MDSSGRYSPKSIAWKATPDVCHILSSRQVHAQCGTTGSIANKCSSTAACELVSFNRNWHVTLLRQFVRLLLGPSPSAGSDSLFGALSTAWTSPQHKSTNTRAVVRPASSASGPVSSAIRVIRRRLTMHRLSLQPDPPRNSAFSLQHVQSRRPVSNRATCIGYRHHCKIQRQTWEVKLIDAKPFLNLLVQ